MEDQAKKQLKAVTWEKAESITKVLSGILIPLIGAWVGWLIHESSTNAELLKQSIAELSKSKEETDPALRDWAVDVFVETSPVPVSRELEQALRLGSVSLRQRLGAPLGPTSNLSGLNLNGKDLSELNLRQSNLSMAHLGKSNLSRSDLSESILAGALLREANLREANLHHAVLDFADLRGASLVGANLEGASLKGIDIRHTDLRAVHGLEARQLLVGDATTFDISTGINYEQAQWDEQTRFPDGVRKELLRLGLLNKRRDPNKIKR